ncbi:unnamed protein product [Amoebophrya sp. A120]|nr:unnamed protein product [Amoebophrya sp. A120]|eukprot:GSA120T00017393001.1
MQAAAVAKRLRAAVARNKNAEPVARELASESLAAIEEVPMKMQQLRKNFCARPPPLLRRKSSKPWRSRWRRGVARATHQPHLHAPAAVIFPLGVEGQLLLARGKSRIRPSSPPAQKRTQLRNEEKAVRASSAAVLRGPRLPRKSLPDAAGAPPRHF